MYLLIGISDPSLLYLEDFLIWWSKFLPFTQCSTGEWFEVLLTRERSLLEQKFWCKNMSFLKNVIH